MNRIIDEKSLIHTYTVCLLYIDYETLFVRYQLSETLSYRYSGVARIYLREGSVIKPEPYLTNKKKRKKKMSVRIKIKHLGTILFFKL